MSIRNAAMENSAKVNSRRKARKQELIQLLDVAQDPSMLVDEEQLALAQLELEAMTEADARRAISKSRVRWLVKGGKTESVFSGYGETQPSSQNDHETTRARWPGAL